MVEHADPITQDRPSGISAGWIDCDYTDAVALAPANGHEAIHQARLPRAWRAGQANDRSLACAGKDFAKQITGFGRSFLYEADRTGKSSALAIEKSVKQTHHQISTRLRHS
jgi:hypothetical protein